MTDWEPRKYCLNCNLPLKEYSFYDVPKDFCSPRCEERFVKERGGDYYRCPFCGLFTSKKELKE